MDGFWARRYSSAAKRWLLGVLALCFVAQTYLVYSDPAPEESTLSSEALVGRRLWQAHGCNFCHQLYGFGGFLGPDLTNAVSWVTPARFKQVLTEGVGAMPAFHFTDEQISALRSFLEAMDASGQGQARIYAEEDDELLDKIEEQVQGRPLAARGFELFQSHSCVNCHRPLGVSPVGAPDPSTISLSPEELSRVLTEGRPPRMPKPNLAPDEREAVAEFLSWLAEQRDSLRSGTLDLSELPWWEFR